MKDTPISGGSSSPRQLSLLARTGPIVPQALKPEGEFIRELSSLIAEPARIILTHNRSSLISCRTSKDGVKEVRLQHGFRSADGKFMRTLARFLQKPDRRSHRAVDAFIRERWDLFEVMAREGPPRCGSNRGRRRDLRKILARVMRDHGFKLRGLNIVWGIDVGKTRQSSIKFGTYHHSSRTITIHPALDQPEIPDYFVEFIVFHEILHALFPPRPGGGGRRELHGAEFKRFERKFKRYEEAREFEQRFVQDRLR